jgi:replication-associated recombination protein RarA
MHLRNAPTRLMKDLGHGAGYRYAHDEAGGFAAGERYLPEGPGRPALLRAGAARAWNCASASGWPNCGALNDEAKKGR